MSIVVPPVDLAPSLPSRIVTVRVTDLPEGGLIDAPGWIEFVLPGDLRVPGDDIIVRAGSVRLNLDASGEGRVRLPVHNSAAQGDGVGGDWFLLVQKSWTQQVDKIRVPAGSGSVSLADIAPVVTVTPAMGQWLITNATATGTEGSQWGASVSVDGGIAHFDFTFPPGGTAWSRGLLSTDRGLSDMYRAADRGVWQLGGSWRDDLPADAPAGILPNQKLFVVESFPAIGRQWLSFYGYSGLWTRVMNQSGTVPRGWTAWKRVDVDWSEVETLKEVSSSSFHRHAVTLADGTDLNTMRTRASNGAHVLGSTQSYSNLPPRPGSTVGVLYCFSSGTGDTWHRVVWRFNGGVYERYETAAGSFTEWRRVDSTDSGGVGPDVEGRLRLLEASAPLESVFTSAGRISTLGEQRAFLSRLDRMFDSVTLASIGETSRGTQMQSVTIGDPEKPALVLMCAQHGDEIAGSEAVLPWLQTLAAAPPTDICVVVLPAVNVDSFTLRRLTPSTTDLNRNWTTRTTAEVQAVTSVLAAHDVVAVLDCHEGGNWTDCQIAKPTAPGVGTAVLTASQALYTAVWDGLEAADLPVSEYPGADDVDVARNALALTEKLPILVIETPSQLGGTEWDGPEPNPRLYQPSLATRVQMYHAVFDAALGWAQDQV